MTRREGQAGTIAYRVDKHGRLKVLESLNTPLILPQQYIRRERGKPASVRLCSGWMSDLMGNLRVQSEGRITSSVPVYRFTVCCSWSEGARFKMKMKMTVELFDSRDSHDKPSAKFWSKCGGLGMEEPCRTPESKANASHSDDVCLMCHVCEGQGGP